MNIQAGQMTETICINFLEKRVPDSEDILNNYFLKDLNLNIDMAITVCWCSNMVYGAVTISMARLVLSGPMMGNITNDNKIFD